MRLRRRGSGRRRLLPNRIGVQIGLVIAAAILLAHLVFTVLLFVVLHVGEDERLPPRGGPDGTATGIAVLARALEAVPDPAGRAAVLARVAAGGGPAAELRAEPGPTVAGPGAGGPAGDLLRRRLGPDADVRTFGGTGGAPALAVRLGGNGGPSWLVAPVPDDRRPPGPFVGGQLLLGLLILAGAITGASVWASRRLIRPLARFAAAVDRFRLDGEDPPLPESGPLEVRQAVGAFNRMRERVRGAALERTRTLAAISHDLRSPLARLRLRAEALEGQAERGDILRDLERMEGLLGSALGYLRGQAVDEPVVPVDLPSLLETVRDHHAELGHDVTYEGPDRLAWRCRPQGLERAVDNLVANAVRHGARVVVRLTPAAGGGLVVEVEDDGPGIPAAERGRAVEPFRRGDAERDPSRPGFGLGLAIVADIAAAHGGRLELADARPHGLVARILLPPQGGGPDRRPPHAGGVANLTAGTT